MKHEFARRLRREMTDFERTLWYALRDRRFLSRKFRRQQPISPYIVDFVCFETKLVIELDGGQHALPENAVNERVRAQFLEHEGFRILRFWNLELRDNMNGVLEAIRLALDEGPLTRA